MNKAFVFDFDDTLIETDARVIVRSLRDGSVLKRITPAEYNHWSLAITEQFDFSEFTSVNKILDGELTFVANLAKEVSEEHQSVYILTARHNEVADIISGFLKSKGIHAKEIFCVGSDDGSVDIAKEKRKILLTIIENYDKIYFYDDDARNIELAESIGSNKTRNYKV